MNFAKRILPTKSIILTSTRYMQLQYVSPLKKFIFKIIYNFAFFKIDTSIIA